MKPSAEPAAQKPEASSLRMVGSARARKRPLGSFGLIAAIIALCYALPIFHWAQFALAKDRNTYLLLIPFVTAYLVRLKRPTVACETAVTRAFLAFCLGASIVVYLLVGQSSWVNDARNRLSLQIFSLLTFLLAGAFVTVGARTLRQVAFPTAFLVLAVPLPLPVVDAIEIFLQRWSAEAAYWMLRLTDIPLLREGLVFKLPGIALEVAQECSGFNASWVLFIVSTVAGYLFLKSPVRRAFLTAAIIPLAIIRNGFRVLVIAMLCVHIGPEMVDSFIHRHGGPIFFALSLIPFGVLLWALRRSEKKTQGYRNNFSG